MRMTSSLLMVLIILLTGCNSNNETENVNYYLSLMGESENWNLKDYEIEITEETFKAGNGFLDMKGKDDHITDSFYVEVHAVINHEDKVIQRYGVTGSGINIAQESTGAIEGGTYLNKDGNPIKLEDINNIYVVLEWWDENQKKNVNYSTKN